MKLCLLGKTGLLGTEFFKLFKKKGFDFISPSSKELNLLDTKKVKEYMEKETPDQIILCVAYTNIDLAEKEKELCEALNVKLVKTLLRFNIPIVHFSSDYVFSAPENMKIPEDFELNPLNFYGKTKQNAEMLIEKSILAGNTHWNIRTSWLFGTSSKNFVSTILKLSKSNTTLKIIDDQIGRPTFAKDLAKAVIKHFIETPFPAGNYHLQNTGNPISWAGFATYFLKQELGNSAPQIEKVSSSQWKNLNFPKVIANRPKNSVLKNTKLPESMRNWKIAVDEYLASIQNK
ncbi:NAD(P)-dependent oxidoreductase [Candidatus Gracilibacteria bacterium]|nr:NAD(P)-dependent oxidoreductase [Candidatus Gracilibacteria bacterium]